MTDHEENIKRFDAFCDALQEFATAKNEWRANAAGERAEAIAETFSEHELARAERFAINLKREDIVSDLPPPDTIAFNDLARVVSHINEALLICYSIDGEYELHHEFADLLFTLDASYLHAVATARDAEKKLEE
jgi:hypothetical protein